MHLENLLFFFFTKCFAFARKKSIPQLPPSMNVQKYWGCKLRIGVAKLNIGVQLQPKNNTKCRPWLLESNMAAFIPQQPPDAVTLKVGPTGEHVTEIWKISPGLSYWENHTLRRSRLNNCASQTVSLGPFQWHFQTPTSGFQGHLTMPQQ